MKKIWIDGYEANVSQRVGSGQVAYELIRNIEKIDQTNDYTVVLPTPPLEDLPKERAGFKYKILKPKPFWTWIALPIALFTTPNKPDVIFSPTHYAPGFSPVKRVMMVMDLGYEHFPQFFKKKDLWQLKLWTWISVKQASHVITISESSLKDTVDKYKINSNKITVAYPGYNRKVYKPVTDQIRIDEVKAKYKINGEYIIFISTLQPRKNVIRLIEAFQKIEGLKLVIVGKTTGGGRSGWMFEEILNKPKELGIEDKIIFTGYAPEEDLPYLITGATAYIQPSLWEGFGIPALESMACGTPALVSNISSLPEVVGDAGLLFDPYSTTQIEQAIRTISSDQKLHRTLSKLSLKQAEKFSWRKMAKEVVEVLERVGDKNA